MKQSARRPPRPLPPAQLGRGMMLLPGFVTPDDRAAVLDWLATLRPLWEQRFSTLRPPPRDEAQRPLLRPVYWLGNWQFACLGYYHPPKKTLARCVEAEPYPAPLARWVQAIEAMARRRLPAADVPAGWSLNTCLINFYGDLTLPDGRREDRARVGDHRDHEPGPVASVSLGERAYFQFTDGRGQPLRSLWLEDRSLQLFAGPHWKDTAFHRVQRVERKRETALPPEIPGFRTRRINFTFRYVPPRDITPFRALPPEAREDVREYVATLAESSPFWARALAEEASHRQP